MILSQVSHLMVIVIGSIHIYPEILLNGTKILKNQDLNGKMVKEKNKVLNYIFSFQNYLLIIGKAIKVAKY